VYYRLDSDPTFTHHVGGEMLARYSNILFIYSFSQTAIFITWNNQLERGKNG